MGHEALLHHREVLCCAVAQQGQHHQLIIGLTAVGVQELGHRAISLAGRLRPLSPWNHEDIEVRINIIIHNVLIIMVYKVNILQYVRA